MKVSPGNAQHIGDREQQQDSFGFSNFADDAFARHGGFMMVLCDGMGGLANGTEASRVAVDTILSGYGRKQPSEVVASALERCIGEAQEAVCAVSGVGGSAGTTVVAAVVWQDRLYWASLGDSRLYLCRENQPARQLTTDHNVATLLDRCPGRDDISDAARSANPEALTEYLGSPHRPQPDIERNGWPLQPGDRVVACSDGLYRALSPAQITAATRRANPMTAAERMIEWVVEQRLPHQDNLTAVLFEVAPLPRLGWLPNLAALGTALGGISARRAPGTSLGSGSLGVPLAAGAGFVAGVVLTLLVGHVDAFGARQIPEPPVASGDPSKPNSLNPGSNAAPSVEPEATDGGDSERSSGSPPQPDPKPPPSRSRSNNGTKTSGESSGPCSAETDPNSTPSPTNARPPGSCIPQTAPPKTGAKSGPSENSSSGASNRPPRDKDIKNDTSDASPAESSTQEGEDGTSAVDQKHEHAKDGVQP